MVSSAFFQKGMLDDCVSEVDDEKELARAIDEGVVGGISILYDPELIFIAYDWY